MIRKDRKKFVLGLSFIGSSSELVSQVREVLVNNLNLEWLNLSGELKPETVISGCCWEVRLVCVTGERDLSARFMQDSVFLLNHMHVWLPFSLVAFRTLLFLFDVLHYLILMTISIFIPRAWSTVCFSLSQKSHCLLFSPRRFFAIKSILVSL